jgi:hypothetical protein
MPNVLKRRCLPCMVTSRPPLASQNVNTIKPNASVVPSTAFKVAPAKKPNEIIPRFSLRKTAEPAKQEHGPLKEISKLTGFSATASDTQKNLLQLVGVVCMLVASKYEEILCINVSGCTYIADNTYTKK